MFTDNVSQVEQGFIDKALGILKDTSFEAFSPEVLASLIVLGLIGFLSLVIFVVFKFANPL